MSLSFRGAHEHHTHALCLAGTRGGDPSSLFICLCSLVFTPLRALVGVRLLSMLFPPPLPTWREKAVTGRESLAEILEGPGSRGKVDFGSKGNPSRVFCTSILAKVWGKAILPNSSDFPDLVGRGGGGPTMGFSTHARLSRWVGALGSGAIVGGVRGPVPAGARAVALRGRGLWSTELDASSR